jgi:formylglycine-generating enzyme
MVLALGLRWVLAVLTATAASPRAGMIRIARATFEMGTGQSRHADEAPPHRVELDAFDLDETVVTFADFDRFVRETGHVTTAEKLGFGMTSFEGMKDWTWKKVEGATFRAPWGREHEKDIPLSPDLPVVMVSWLDADAYCRHRGKRLPTEAEWEYAMRAGTNGTRFPWGDRPERAGKGMGLNFWQGPHEHNQRADGYLYLSPVKAFPPNAFGLYDPVGNVWQWVQDWYAEDTYEKDRARGVARNPRGPSNGKRKASRGGSWWCSKTTCYGYTLYARGKNAPDAVFSNNGFRCAADAESRVIGREGARGP